MFGVFIFIYGGHDDSSGGQLLEVVAVIGDVAGLLKSKRRSDLKKQIL